MKAELAIKEVKQPIKINRFEEAISYKGVSFAYEESEVLKDIQLEIKKGTTVALVGQSGGGKSTLVDLLPRFYDPKAGSVEIDGNDIKHYRISELRALMGVVSQQSILFNDTVFNNITLGTENATEDEVIEAAKIANAHEFIEKLPEGYQTNIGDGGDKLSGGQKQRLSIARAVLKNPPIMILDEATSALDTESEQLVQEALNNLMANRTSLIIAHRLSTIQHADQIVVVHEGKIVEQGTHAELIEKQGIYKRLTDLQTFA